MAVGLLGVGVAAADTSSSDVTVSAGVAQLKPAPGGGYAGQLPISLQYAGPANRTFLVTVALPAGLTLSVPADSPLQTCVRAQTGQQSGWRCVLSNALSDGERRTINAQFTALAAPTRQARKTEEATVHVDVTDGGAPLPDPTSDNNTARYHGLLAGTGNGTAHRVYQPAAKSDMTLTTGDTVFAPMDDGTYAGTVTLTLKALTDATHDHIAIKLDNPPDGTLYLRATNPVVHCMGSCSYNPMPQATQQTVTLVVQTSRPFASGTKLSFSVQAIRDGNGLGDAKPADNVAVSTVR
jgi:hypothetical protein